MMEQWRVIPDTDGIYWASDLGRVKALARVINGRKMKEKILRLTPQSDGYVQARINGKGQLVHRLVYLAWVGPIPKGMLVRHLDDIPTHNWLSNLALGDCALNAADAKRNGRGHGKPLSAKKSEELRAWILANPSVSYEEVRLFASSFGCSPRSIRRHQTKLRQAGLL